MDALSAIPNRILLSAYDAKRADHDCIARRLALTSAEIKSSKRRQAFLATICEQHDGNLAVSQEYLGILERMLDNRGISAAKDDERYYHVEYANKAVALNISDMQLGQVLEVLESCTESDWVPDDDEDSLAEGSADDRSRDCEASSDQASKEDSHCYGSSRLTSFQRS